MKPKVRRLRAARAMRRRRRQTRRYGRYVTPGGTITYHRIPRSRDALQAIHRSTPE